jgi:hypothetical protein
MPVAANFGAGKGGPGRRMRHRVAGVYAKRLGLKRVELAELDGRAARIRSQVADYFELGYVADVDELVRRRLVREIESMEAGKPQVIPASDLDGRGLDARAVPFLEPLNMDEIASEELAERPWLVRIYADDAVDVAQTRRQHGRQVELVQQGHKVRVNAETGEPVIQVLDASTGELRDIRPGDAIVYGKPLDQEGDSDG